MSCRWLFLQLSFFFFTVFPSTPTSIFFLSIRIIQRDFIAALTVYPAPSSRILLHALWNNHLFSRKSCISGFYFFTPSGTLLCTIYSVFRRDSAKEISSKYLFAVMFSLKIPVLSPDDQTGTNLVLCLIPDSISAYRYTILQLVQIWRHFGVVCVMHHNDNVFGRNNRLKGVLPNWSR